ncbi:type II toxin-antitoxin system VapC family toxin [Thalassotalea sp. G20_0]|uniref:type II toxin-antitoxin system VapC family toxin n=1 Tax=Thalassotalea sp. G20_0 TaxID=2821093 RepID=UPI001AD9C946|nr:type II toxin-antitoxin system VapC family toxin [Thalassotalea sp. G20_0]MBO9494788.1 type II toxin-antitoxin system VapC family toxin [Thalassotalea sp. G20_0]
MTRAVIDTMVFAYALFNEPLHRQDALAVLAKTEYIHVPDLFRAEFCNVAWQWITHQQLSLHQAIQATERAEALITSVTSSERLWFKALELATYTKHPAYNALFVVLAETLDCPLVTWDKKLLRNFPDIAMTPERLLKP